jgi:hypothetical protein
LLRRRLLFRQAGTTWCRYVELELSRISCHWQEMSTASMAAVSRAATTAGTASEPTCRPDSTCGVYYGSDSSPRGHGNELRSRQHSRNKHLGTWRCFIGYGRRWHGSGFLRCGARARRAGIHLKIIVVTIVGVFRAFLCCFV